MIKKEIIWRHILESALAKGKHQIATFTQKKIAEDFGFSTCTVNNALNAPRKIGAIEVTGRFFRVRDIEKILMLWATQRNLEKDIIYQAHVNLQPSQIEGAMPPETIYGAFSAFRLKYNEAPADYSTVYIYSNKPEEIIKRFPKTKGIANLFVLKADPWLAAYGQTTPDCQTFVDLWNLRDWYAKDFLDALQTKMGI